MPTSKLAVRKGDTHKPSTIVRIGDFTRIGGDAVARIADVLQIGAGNMRNFALLGARNMRTFALLGARNMRTFALLDARKLAAAV